MVLLKMLQAGLHSPVGNRSDSRARASGFDIELKL